jgi:signal peptidase II
MRRFLPRLSLPIILTILGLDQLSKWWILDVIMQPVERVVEVTPFFNLVLTWNKGVTFGMLVHDADLMPYVLSAIAVVIILILVRWLMRSPSRMATIALSLIIGGALGNVIDRLRFGAVVDFLDFHAFGYHWYAFNVADSAVVIGVGLLLLDGLALGRRKG